MAFVYSAFIVIVTISLVSNCNSTPWSGEKENNENDLQWYCNQLCRSCSGEPQYSADDFKCYCYVWDKENSVVDWTWMKRKSKVLGLSLEVLDKERKQRKRDINIAINGDEDNSPLNKQKPETGKIAENEKKESECMNKDNDVPSETTPSILGMPHRTRLHPVPRLPRPLRRPLPRPVPRLLPKPLPRPLRRPIHRPLPRLHIPKHRIRPLRPASHIVGHVGPSTDTSTTPNPDHNEVVEGIRIRKPVIIHNHHHIHKLGNPSHTSTDTSTTPNPDHNEVVEGIRIRRPVIIHNHHHIHKLGNPSHTSIDTSTTPNPDHNEVVEGIRIRRPVIIHKHHHIHKLGNPRYTKTEIPNGDTPNKNIITQPEEYMDTK